MAVIITPDENTEAKDYGVISRFVIVRKFTSDSGNGKIDSTTKLPVIKWWPVRNGDNRDQCIFKGNDARWCLIAKSFALAFITCNPSDRLGIRTLAWQSVSSEGDHPIQLLPPEECSWRRTGPTIRVRPTRHENHHQQDRCNESWDSDPSVAISSKVFFTVRLSSPSRYITNTESRYRNREVRCLACIEILLRSVLNRNVLFL